MMTTPFHKMANTRTPFHDMAEKKDQPITPVYQMASREVPKPKDYLNAIDNEALPGRKLDLILNMPREEFIKLPFEKQREFSKLISEETQRQTSTQMYDWIPGVQQGVERMKEAGQIPQAEFGNEGSRAALGLLGQAPVYMAMGTGIGAISPGITSKIAPVLGRAAPLTTKTSLWAGTGAAYEAAKKIGSGKGA